MKKVLVALSCCLILALSGCPQKKQEGEAVPTESVEGTSSAPSDANSEASPDEMQKKDNTAAPEGAEAPKGE